MGIDFSQVINTILDNKVVAFIKKHQSKIKTGYQLAAALERLTEEERFDFATDLADKIADGTDLATVLEVLPEEGRLEFANVVDDYKTSAVTARPFT